MAKSVAKTKAKTPAKAKPRKPRGRPKKWTVDQMEEGLRAGVGFATRTAKFLSEKYNMPCDRRTVTAYVDANSRLQAVLEDIDETLLDAWEGKAFKVAADGDGPMIRWLLAKRGQKRGYGEVVKVEGKMDHTGKIEHDHKHSIEQRAKQLEGMLSDDAIELLEADLSGKVN